MAAFAVLAVTACATLPPVSKDQSFAALGGGAVAYVYVPVKPNEKLATGFLSTLTSDPSAIVGRTDVAYLALFTDGSLRAIAEGSYPSSFASVAFPRSKGWTRQKKTGIGAWYENGSAAAALPGNRIACFALGSNGALPQMLTTLRSPSNIPAVPQTFVNDALHAAYDGSISVFSPNPEPFVAALLGPEVTLPIDSATATLTPAGEAYDLTLLLSAKTERMARAVLTLARLAAPQGEFSASGTEVTLSLAGIPAERLAEFMKFSYFMNNLQ